LALIVLSISQSSLLYNTYQLEKKAYTITSFDAASTIYNSEDADSVFWEYRLDLKSKLIDYDNQKISNQELKSIFKQNCEKLDKKYRPHYLEKLKEKLDFNILFQIIAKEIILYSGDSIPDTLLFPYKTPIKVLGFNINKEDKKLINTNIWQENLYQKENSPFLRLKTEVYISIEDWSILAIQDMLWILIGSVIIFIVVIFLLQYSIKNLIKQKRNADIQKDFIDNITHEFKTPLSTISIATDMLSEQSFYDKPESIVNTVKIIKRQNKRLQKLLDLVITRSLANRNDISLRFELVDITKYFELLIEDFKISEKAQSAIINYYCQNEPIDILIDKFFLSVAFLNLLSNSVKYGGTKIEVNVKEDQDFCVISVKDNGIGIDSKYQSHIFDKFYRISEKNKNDYKGLGLGLYYTKEIVKAHKGTILLDTQQKEGAHFIIKIPKKKKLD
jgi:signal transduction histidine kinase